MRWREKPITATERMKNESTDSVPDTKSAEQSDGNIWRSNSFKKKGKGYRCTAESIFIYSKILWLWKAGIRGRHQWSGKQKTVRRVCKDEEFVYAFYYMKTIVSNRKLYLFVLLCMDALSLIERTLKHKTSDKLKLCLECQVVVNPTRA